MIFVNLILLNFFFSVLSQTIGVICLIPISMHFSKKFSNLDVDFNNEIPICKFSLESYLEEEIILSVEVFFLMHSILHLNFSFHNPDSRLFAKHEFFRYLRMENQTKILKD